MKGMVINILQKTKNRRISIYEIETDLKKIGINIFSDIEQRSQFIKTITDLINNDILIPLKNATPLQQYGRLPDKYTIQKRLISEIFSPLPIEHRNELLSLSPPLKIDYYATHAAQYAKDREYIFRIDEVVRQKDCDELTANERSFLLFGDEKAITMPADAAVNGDEILKNLGLTLHDIKAKKVFEPFFWIEKNFHSLEGSASRKALIVENKDTFWTLQNAIISGELNDVNLVIYGEGYAIIKKFDYIETIRGSTSDQYFYFGDLDLEGIKIYNKLRKKFDQYDIKPAVSLYTYILYKAGYENAKPLRKLQKTSETSLSPFIDFFKPEDGDIIKKLIGNGKYLPQEIFNKTDLKELKRSGIF